jgi:hypothetical protein
MPTVSQWEQHLRAMLPTQRLVFKSAIRTLQADPLYGAERGLELGQLDIILDEINKDPQLKMDTRPPNDFNIMDKFRRTPAIEPQRPAFDMAVASELATMAIDPLNKVILWEDVKALYYYATRAQRFIRELLK